ncbi:MAG: A-type flagellin [Pelotomaculum sp. PtaU1.Bin035]|nr:MAG: A-type flagellin [Pelotomaculum sp. PtaU1.Bin035]
MRINHNISALNTYRQLSINTTAGSKSLEKLSSGLRVNRAGDDAAGLAISEKMRGQIRGLSQASRNSQDTISLLQTAEGALNETHSILQRMRELAVQAAGDTNTSVDRKAIQDEVTQLTKEIDRIATTTEFNTKKLINGDLVGVQGAIAGVIDKEGSFANGTVALGKISYASLAVKTDVIRINIVRDTFTNGSSISTTGAFCRNMFSVTTVLGNISAAKVIFSTAGGVYISGAASTGAATVTMRVSLSLAQMKALKSGDTITISVTKKAAAQTDSSKQIRAQIGANAGQELGIGINDMGSNALGVRKTDGTALDITTQVKASGAIKLINNALEKVSTERSKLGAFQNRLEHTINNLDTSAENLQASESRIRDVDMAKEMMEYTKNNILTQAAQAMLAQANQAPQGVLQLLR